MNRIKNTVASVLLGIVAVGTMGAAAQATTYPAAYRIAAAKLAQRPALIKPGQWQSPTGKALVAECFASYPKVGSELYDCLTQPDPRVSDPSVMTVHEYHVNHLNRAHRAHLAHLAHLNHQG